MTLSEIKTLLEFTRQQNHAILETLDGHKDPVMYGFRIGEETMLDYALELLGEVETAPAAERPQKELAVEKEYAEAVKTWLVQYQVKTTELRGRYTPYEVLGWVVNDWRRENDC